MVTGSSAPGRNWGGEYRYTARRLLAPATVDELQAAVTAADRIRPLGTRHSFNDVADTDGDLVTIAQIPAGVDVDSAEGTAWVGAGMSYAQVAAQLDSEGWALENLASLPHISVGGAISTGTHGSGTQSLAAAVVGIEFVAHDGEVRRFERDAEEFEAAIVSIGVIGVLLRVGLRIVPRFDVAQVAFDGVTFEAALDNLETLFEVGDSVSLFTDWQGTEFTQVWVKSRVGRELPDDVLGGLEASEDRHPVRGTSADSCTVQRRRPGSWSDRLPHFRAGYVPSSGREIQSEYLVPRRAAAEATRRMRGLGNELAGVIQVSEMRTVRADGLWLSPAYREDVVGFHFTWQPYPDAVARAVELIEDRLRPLGARPHWGKVHNYDHHAIRAVYPRSEEFAVVVADIDPSGKFRGPAFNRWFIGEGDI